MTGGRLALLAALAVVCGSCSNRSASLAVGSKSFTEGIILGETLTLLAREAGIPARHRRGLGGTRLVFNALAGGEIDAYVEYTGTLINEIFAAAGNTATIGVATAGSAAPPAVDAAARRDRQSSALDRIRAELEVRGLGMSEPIGFENNYALGMPAARAAELGITKISDLAQHPELRLRLSNEFMDRADGWPGLQRRYALPQTDVAGVDHDIAYRALAAGDADLTDLYTTDAELEYYGLVALADDREFFPHYAAVVLYRRDLAERFPGAIAALTRLVGRVDTAAMSALNAEVKLGGSTESAAARDLVARLTGTQLDVAVAGLAARVLRRSGEHLVLVSISLLGAVLIALPLGILAARYARLGQVLLGVVGIAQTVPALALLVMLVPLFGIGAGPALIALFIYSLLPILRNTHAGLTGIAPALRDSATALGLPLPARLWRIELPLALPTLLAGIKTAAVINVGGATLGALVGAGGFGQPILSGIRLDNTALILEGAIPAAVLALGVQGLFELAERRCVPRGLRLRS